MNQREMVERAHGFCAPFRISDGEHFKLKRIDPGDTLDLKAADKPRAQAALAEGVQLLAELQARLYAEDRRALLLVFQAMDAAGQDGTINNVMSGLNPQGSVAIGQVQGLQARHQFVFTTVPTPKGHAHGQDVHEQQHQDAADHGHMGLQVFAVVGQEHHVGAARQG